MYTAFVKKLRAKLFIYNLSLFTNESRNNEVFLGNVRPTENTFF